VLKLAHSSVEFKKFSRDDTPGSASGAMEEAGREIGGMEGGKEKEKGRKKNGDHSPTSFGLKVALNSGYCSPS